MSIALQLPRQHPSARPSILLCVVLSAALVAACGTSTTSVPSGSIATIATPNPTAGPTGSGAATSVTRTFTISMATQTITFVNPGPQTMAESPLTVSATASSGLVVTFTTSTPSVCTTGDPNGATITLVGPGTCTVKADQPGTAVYKPAPTVSRNFTVR